MIYSDWESIFEAWDDWYDNWYSKYGDDWNDHYLNYTNSWGHYLGIV